MKVLIAEMHKYIPKTPYSKKLTLVETQIQTILTLLMAKNIHPTQKRIVPTMLMKSEI